MTESKVTHYQDGGVCFQGPDAIRLVSALTLWSALGLAAHGIMPTRGMTRKRLLTIASTYTNRPYVNSLKGLEAARVDVKRWADEMRAALPHEVKT